MTNRRYFLVFLSAAILSSTAFIVSTGQEKSELTLSKKDHEQSAEIASMQLKIRSLERTIKGLEKRVSTLEKRLADSHWDGGVVSPHK